MASKIKVRIKGARDLPVMDRNQNLDASTDAFAEVRIGDQEYHTQVVRKSLNPQWDEEFTFEFIDDYDIQSEPLAIKVLDQDTYSAEVIGVLYVNLSPLLIKTAYHSDSNDFSIRGWFHLFDTVWLILLSDYIISVQHLPLVYTSSHLLRSLPMLLLSKSSMVLLRTW